jgi:hypothetical protein
MEAISRAVASLAEHRVQVLSPADPRVVDSRGEFLFVASDYVRSVRLVQDRHLESIRASHFLWLICPDGYVGQSASMEVGFAVANSIPVLGQTSPTDLTLRQYLRVVPSISEALTLASTLAARTRPPDHFLLDPHASIESAHATLEQIRASMRRSRRATSEDYVQALRSGQASLRRIFTTTGLSLH